MTALFQRSFQRLLGAGIALLLAGAARGQWDPPAGYYNSASGKTGTVLKTSLHGVIASHTVLTYTPSVWDALTALERDPANPSGVMVPPMFDAARDRKSGV